MLRSFSSSFLPARDNSARSFLSTESFESTDHYSSHRTIDISKSLQFGFYESSSSTHFESKSICQSHRIQSLSNIASFGIFDGHKGTFASDLCAKEMHSNVLDTFVNLSKELKDHDEGINLTSEEKVDAILCKSLLIACQNMDDYIQRHEDDSGTCALSLFFIRNGDGSTRVVCSNIGDSRCVLYGPRFASVKYLESNSSDFLKSKSCSYIRSYQMSEDHRVSLLRERTRVMGKTKLSENTWKDRPTTVFVSLPAAVISYEQVSKLRSVCPTFELGYPPRDRIKAADGLLAELDGDHKFVPLHALSDFTDATLEESSSTEEFFSGLPPVRASGCLHGTPRQHPPVAHIATTVRTTRSIGDRYAPDGLIAVPEMSAVTVLPNESARFILGFRSFWDNVSEDEVRKAVLKYLEPRDLARALGAIAEARNKEKMVCVVVVDLLRPEDMTNKAGCTIA